MASIRLTQQSNGGSSASASKRPLSHHEILALIEPFTRRGRQVDLAASRREDRTLVFKALDHAPLRASASGLREILELTVSEGGNYHLSRLLHPIGSEHTLSASVSASGDNLELLLTQLEGFDLARLFPPCGECDAQRSYRLEPPTANDADVLHPWRAHLLNATATIDGVELKFDAAMRGMPVKIRLVGPLGQQLRIPRDLLAVLGRHWRTLEDYGDHWRSTVRVPKREPKRSRHVDAVFERSVAHLRETLKQPPSQYHERHWRRRWLASLQRGIPIGLVLAAIGGILMLGQNPLDNNALLTMLAFHLPPILLMVFFVAFDELPPFEIPRIPRALKHQHWLGSKLS